MNSLLKKSLIAAVLLLAAVLSFTLIADRVSEPETHAKRIEAINGRIETVLKLTASSTVTSVGISALPEDIATPIADKLADLSTYFLLVLCILYSEKYLLTIVGAAVFRILIPGACLLFIVSLFRGALPLRRLGAKLLICSIILYLAIPLSIRASDMVYDTYRLSIEQSLAAAQELNEKTDELRAAAGDDSLLQAALKRISETVSTLADRAANILNRFIESAAVMIVTSCIIPVLALLFFLWIIKVLLGAGAGAVPALAPYLPAARKQKSLPPGNGDGSDS